jgi:hypothetical protein
MTQQKSPLKRHHDSIDPRIKVASNVMYAIVGIAIIYFVGGMVGLAVGGLIAAASAYGVCKTVMEL